MSTPVFGASHYETELEFFEGKYEVCEEIARDQVQRGVWNELWPELLIRCLLVQGKYDQARQAYEDSLSRYRDRIAYRLVGAEVYRHVNESALAKEQLDQIFELVRRSPWRYGSSRDQVTLGRFFAAQGEDARQILELIYDPVRKQNPNYAEVYIATAELALEKHDDAFAAEQLEVAAKLQPTNPYVHYLAARAWRNQDGERATASLQQALTINPRHVPSLLLQVDQLIDAERYDAAEKILEEVLTINCFEPRAWAYHAVIAHLQGHYQGEQAIREIALAPWHDNWDVDYLIGLKLSQKYRFREGASYQRLALAKRPNASEVRFQLANDLLRLGDTQEGWELAEQVHTEDGYHVVAYNLVTLKQQLDRFRTLETDHFVVRMDATEAEIYGDQVLTLLEQAFAELCPKYDVQLDGPVYVEIFPRQEDFAIRTFGLPGGAGYLGVCFGRLITANSPASQGTSPTNWQSVLWHEFCHVVTLEKTRNRMPRWLSEGISVYEEVQQNPGWGQSMSANYRDMVLSDQLTPVSGLSGAFLRPPSGLHLQFAYYESSLVVEFLIDQIGQDGLNRILDDLAVGMTIEETLQRYVGASAQVDVAFTDFARGKAEEFSAGLAWDRQENLDRATTAEIAELLAEQPNNYFVLRAAAEQAIASGDAESALPHLEVLANAVPSDTEVARLIAQAYRKLENREAEVKALRRIAQHDADAIDAFTRLAELSETTEDWQALQSASEQLVAINPLVKRHQNWVALAARQQGDNVRHVQAQQALLQMDPADPAGAHYELAQAYWSLGRSGDAKRQVLMALEEAPRYRDAHRLLLEIIASEESPVE